jgi:hypothetical protein
MLLLACFVCHADVVLRQLPDRVTVTIDGRDFGSLYFGKDANKPFFHPFTTPDGVQVTRGFPVAPVPGEPEDHPHQKGLWIGTERLSGMDLWENDRTYKRPRMGSVQFVDVTRLKSGSRGELGFRADWLSPERKLLVTEDRLMTFFAAGSNAHVLDVDVTLTAREAVTFEDHQDAIIGTRLAPAFDEKNGGMPMNAEGYRGEAGVRGRASRFLDWRTTIGGKSVGVAILDHPANLHAPARWHLRSFGFFTANPFARKSFDPGAESGAKPMAAGEKLRLRYRVVVYSGEFDVDECWQEFAR